MAKIDLLLDTNILIKIWRGDAELEQEINKFGCAIDTVVCLEFLQGVNKKQQKRADEFVKRFEFLPFTPMISQLAVGLIRKFSHKEGLRMPDALIAATALDLNLPLLTLNKKHFEFINGLDLI
ncbi:MAG: PIN domain-containing protein [Pyrinomonadaceae bacterium]